VRVSRGGGKCVLHHRLPFFYKPPGVAREEHGRREGGEGNGTEL